METKSKIKLTAQRMLNLFRQSHVIFGGWSVINPVFIAETDEGVISELRDMPDGMRLIRHIEMLRSGKTPMNSIARENLPYGGAMESAYISSTINLSSKELSELRSVLSDFQPDASHLEKVKSTNVVKKFGEEWITRIRIALSNDDMLSEKWRQVTQTQRAYELWDLANYILGTQLTERSLASVQADLPEYETYLPMFGDSGKELLGRLRGFVSSSK